jgi:hypothetical protein
MKKPAISFAVVLVCILSVTTALAQNVSTGISITDGHLNNFYFSISDYYRVPETRVVDFRNRYRMHDEELPVIFFLASRAHADPRVIIDLRMRKRMSWLDITFHFGLTPEIYYVPVKRVGPPYGKAYGYYKKHGKDYRKVVLADNDVVNLVNLRFMSDYHGIAPEVIMDKRGKGEKFDVMNDEFRKSSENNHGHKKSGKKDSPKENKNNGRRQGNGRS